MSNIRKRPTWELRNMVKALSLHSWNNIESEEKGEEMILIKMELSNKWNLEHEPIYY